MKENKVMLEPDIYERRFKEKAKSLGHTSDGEEEAIMQYREDGIAPALAVSKHYSKMRLKTLKSEKNFDEILEVVCQSSGVTLDEVKDTDTQIWRDIKSISCVIAVKDKDIRPHSVMRKALGLKYNSMVNHYFERASRRDDSITFQTVLVNSRKILEDV